MFKMEIIFVGIACCIGALINIGLFLCGNPGDRLGYVISAAIFTIIAFWISQRS